MNKNLLIYLIIFLFNFINIFSQESTIFKYIEEDNINKVIEYIENGNDINIKDIDGNTPLMIACYNMNYQIIEKIIDGGANINQQNNEYKTAFYFSLNNRYENILAVDYYDEYFSKNIIMAGNISLSKDFLVSFFEENPLLVSNLKASEVYFEKSKVIQLLLRNNADLQIELENKTTLLEYIFTKDDDNLINMILSTDVSEEEIDRMSDLVILNKNIDSFKWCLKRAFIKLFDPIFQKGEFEINHIDLNGNNYLIDLLDSDFKLKDFGNFMFNYHSRYAEVKWLVEQGINLNFKNNFGLTALHFAVRNEQFDIIKLLIENNADINSKDEEGNTPLMIAAYLGNEELIKYLILNGANISEKNKYEEDVIGIIDKMLNFGSNKYTLIKNKNLISKYIRIKEELIKKGVKESKVKDINLLFFIKTYILIIILIILIINIISYSKKNIKIKAKYYIYIIILSIVLSVFFIFNIQNKEFKKLLQIEKKFHDNFYTYIFNVKKIKAGKNWTYCLSKKNVRIFHLSNYKKIKIDKRSEAYKIFKKNYFNANGKQSVIFKSEKINPNNILTYKYLKGNTTLYYFKNIFTDEYLFVEKLNKTK